MPKPGEKGGGGEVEWTVNQAQVDQLVIATLTDFVRDWGLDEEIGKETRIVEDLEFDSIDVIQLTVALEAAFGSRKIMFQDLLMADGRYVDDLTVAQFQEFIGQWAREGTAA